MTEASAWSNTDAKEVESLVVKYAKEGMSTSQIGIVLRDKHAVPNARLVLGKASEPFSLRTTSEARTLKT